MEQKVEENTNQINIKEELQDEQRKKEKYKKRIEKMKKEKRRQELFRKYSIIAVCFILVVSYFIIKKSPNKIETENLTEENTIIEEEEEINSSEYVVEVPSSEEEEGEKEFRPDESENINGFSEEIVSEYGIFIDVTKEKILAKKNAYEKMYPASMTKILTILVAAENIDNLDDYFTMTIDITDYSYKNDCSSVGFEVGEKIPLIDLFYGTILPSGADAALGLAYYVAGSQEAFVDLMNDKIRELGIGQTTHFTNCVGIYDKEHYSTAYDMAIILNAALNNDLCKQVMSIHTYTTSETSEHPEGITMSNWFLRRIEDRDTHAEVLCAKTGYVTQSGNCAASYGIDKEGNEYICVTAKSSSVWKCIKDQTILYAKYLPE